MGKCDIGNNYGNEGSDSEPIQFRRRILFSLEERTTEQKILLELAEGFYAEPYLWILSRRSTARRCSRSITIELYKELENTGFYIIDEKDTKRWIRKNQVVCYRAGTIIGSKTSGLLNWQPTVFCSALDKNKSNNSTWNCIVLNSEKRLVKYSPTRNRFGPVASQKVAYVQGMNEDSHFIEFKICLQEYTPLTPTDWWKTADHWCRFWRTTTVFPFEKKVVDHFPTE